MDVGVLAEIGGQPDDLRPLAAERHQRLAEGRFDAGAGRRPPPRPCRRCVPAPDCARISHGSPRSRARAVSASHSSGSTRTKCAFSRFSSVGTPLPGSVRSTIAFGRPLRLRGADQRVRRSRPCRCRRSPASPSRRRAICRPPAPCRGRSRRRPGCRCSRSARRDCRARTARPTWPLPRSSPPASRRRTIRRRRAPATPSSRRPSAMPTPCPRPWPSEPPIISTPGVVSSVLISSRLSSAP